MAQARKSVLGAVCLVLIYGLFFYFFSSFLWSKGWLISQDDVTSQNIGFKFLTDTIMNLLCVLVILGLIFFKHEPLSVVGLTNKSSLISVLLLVIYLGMFVAHGDFTIKGFYLAYFYLIVVAFAEEFIFRGFLFTRIDQAYGFTTGIIISGLLFGAMHGILPTILENGSFTDLLMSMSGSLLGQGVLGGGLFALAYKKSGTLFVPVLIHAILDYFGVLYG